MSDHAEMALSLLLELGARNWGPSVHAVGNHMGATVLTEILARRDRGMLPEVFQDMFKVVLVIKTELLCNRRMGELSGIT